MAHDWNGATKLSHVVQPTHTHYGNPAPSPIVDVEIVRSTWYYVWHTLLVFLGVLHAIGLFVFLYYAYQIANALNSLSHFGVG